MRCLLIAIVLLLLMGHCCVHAEEMMDTSKPPLASYGTFYCKTEYVIWVWFDDAKNSVRRYDHEHPMPGDMRKFLAWLETGVHDFEDLSDTRCVTSF